MNLIERVKNILLTPKTEWPVIASEPATVQSVYVPYVLILAALGAVAKLIGMISTPLIGIAAAVIGLILSVGAIFLLGILLNAFAPSFGAEKNAVQAHKTAAYGFTPTLVAGFVAVLGIIPYLGAFLAALIGLIALVYSVYLVIQGLPDTMKTPQDKSLGHGLVATVCTIVAYFIFSFLLMIPIGLMTAKSALDKGMADLGDQFGVQVDGVDDATEKLEAFSKQMEDAAKKMEAADKAGDGKAAAEALGQMMGAMAGGKVEALSSDVLKGFLPESLAGLPRKRFSTEKNAVMGFNVAIAKAGYADESGTRNFDLEITDMGSAKGIMGLAGFVDIEKEEQTETGYEKTYKNGEQWTSEKWNSQSKYGEFSVIVGERFAVKLHGHADSIDELKAAVNDLNLAGLEALKEQGVAQQ